MVDRLEFDSKDIQAHFNGNPVTVKDIQDYVESSVKPTKKKPSAISNPTTDYFVVSQPEYITYLIAKRDSVKRDRRRSLFWSFIKSIVFCVLLITFLLLLCWGFYFSAWLMQQRLI